MATLLVMEDNNVSYENRFMVFFSSLYTSPLFSFFVVLQVLILLYLPPLFLRLVFSPVLIFTGIVLYSLLNHGSTHYSNNQNFPQETEEFDSVDEKPERIEKQTESAPAETTTHCSSNPFLDGTFVEWTRRSPLEVIYEDYEGEDDDVEEGDDDEEPGARSLQKGDQRDGFEGFVNWGLCLPESDTASSSDEDSPMGFPAWDSPENLFFKWEDEKDGMIEIPLRRKGFRVEEENLIEIDLSVSGT
ncbi:hypothetical protein H6P81_005670 [Aristolochia fimbriata]|uniref:Uncharacterized protein n=1 Tax=Aristolochia fimbriata TaxID=158543 RepID=A0AAV7EW80_ARIFI|nr:hypothetical protein H6P81_005670 [Aristolochia fimbriata]